MVSCDLGAGMMVWLLLAYGVVAVAVDDINDVLVTWCFNAVHTGLRSLLGGWMGWS